MSILETILEHKREEVTRAKRQRPLESLIDLPYYARTSYSLKEALTGVSLAVIAEIKQASPSKGIIRRNFDHREIARQYLLGGASALSILTDEMFFQGRLHFITDVRETIPLPLLRKDFVIDSYQLHEAKAAGADAVLLIAAALEPRYLHELYDEAYSLGLECVVEVHTRDEIEGLELSKVEMLGINNRNLATFSTDLETTLLLSKQLPPNVVVISESGIETREDLVRLCKAGVHAVLIGETLMRADNPGLALRTLRQGL